MLGDVTWESDNVKVRNCACCYIRYEEENMVAFFVVCSIDLYCVNPILNYIRLWMKTVLENCLYVWKGLYHDVELKYFDKNGNY